MNIVSSPSFARGLLAVRLLCAATLLLILANGCAFLRPARSQSHYYVLTASVPADVPVPAGKTGADCVVRLQPVEVANYLQSKDIAVRTGSNEMTFDPFQRWAEPLDDGIRRVVAENLRACPEIQAVLTDQAPPAGQSVYTLWIRVLACEGSKTNQQGSAIFKAAWEISGPGTDSATLAQGVFQAPPAAWRADDYGQLAQQLSRAVGEFSRTLARALSWQTSGAPSS